MDIVQEHIDLLRRRLEVIHRQVGPVRRYRAGRNCQKGYNCGGSCITRRKNCRKALEGEAKNFSEWMVQKMSANIGAVVGEAPIEKPKVTTNPTLDKLNEIPSHPSRLKSKKDRESLRNSYKVLLDEIEASSGDNPQIKSEIGKARGSLLSITNNKMPDEMYQQIEGSLRESIRKASLANAPTAVAPPSPPVDLDAKRREKQSKQKQKVTYTEIKPSPYDERTNYPMFIEERYKELERVKTEEIAALPKTRQGITELYPDEIPPDAITRRSDGGYSIEYPQPKTIYRNDKPYSKQWRSSGKTLPEALYQWEVDMKKRDDPWGRVLGEKDKPKFSGLPFAASNSLPLQIKILAAKVKLMQIQHQINPTL